MNFWGYVFLAALLAGGYFYIGAAVLAAFFVVGGWPFWGLLAIAVATAWFIEEKHDAGALAVIPFGVFCFVVHFVSQFNLVEWGKGNLSYLALRAGQYVAAGVVYSLFRWALHANKMAGRLDFLKEEFRREHPFDGSLDKAPDAVRLQFTKYLRGKYDPNLPGETGYSYSYDPAVHGVVPEFSRNLLTNFRRVWWWPFSLLGWFLNDLFREVWEVIRKVMQHIADGFTGLIFGKRANYVLTKAQVAARNKQPPPGAGGLDEDADFSLGDPSPAPRRT